MSNAEILEQLQTLNDRMKRIEKTQLRNITSIDFPTTRSWDWWNEQDAVVRNVAALGRFNIYPTFYPEIPSEVGWVVFAYAVFDNALMGFDIRMTGVSREYQAIASTQLIRTTLGLTTPNAGPSFFAPAATVLMFSPVFPGAPYRKLEVDLVNFDPAAAHNSAGWMMSLLIPIEEMS